MFVFSIYCIFSKKFNKKRPRGKSVNCRGLTRPAAKKTRISPRRSGYTNNTWRTSGALARGVLAVPRARAEVRRRGTARNRRRPTRGDVCGTPFLQGEYHALGTSLKGADLHAIVLLPRVSAHSDVSRKKETASRRR